MYLPLQFYNQMKLEDIPARQPIKPYLLQMIDDDEMFLQLCTDKDLFTDKIQGVITPFSNEIKDHWKHIYRWANGGEPRRPVFTVNYKKFVRNNFIHMIAGNKWGKFKKVYKFDAELELTLCDTDEIKIPIALLDNLPYKDFYIQFAEDGIFSSNFHGCFVSFVKINKTYGLNFCRLNYNSQTMGGFLELDIENDENAFIQKPDIDWERQKGANAEVCADWNEFCFFVINAILYLCAANAEIEEVEPSNVQIKLNKSMAKEEREQGKEDHLQYFECGYRYGQTIRLMKKQQEEQKEDGIETINISSKKRKAPRPHPVKASWQHYWIGKRDGERQRILKFKAPYYQGGISKVATISKVK